MAHALPPTPPPPVYSPVLNRSHSPQTVDGQLLVEKRRSSGGNVWQRKDLSRSPYLSDRIAERGGLLDDTSAFVQVHPPEDSRYIDEPNDNDPVSPILSQFSRRNVSGESTTAPPVPIHMRTASAPSQAVVSSVTTSTFPDESPPEIHEPLQYHHLQDQDMAKRVSRLNVSTPGSAGSASDFSHQPKRHSHLGVDLQRPGSSFSSNSDQRGRNLSPSTTPQRPSSRQSRSPDGRLSSYVDLLNVPYPQPAPSGTENLVNQGLRNAVGENASLLSTRKTLEMYRMNVKKTNDPAIQYEFAIFMIAAAQEEGLEEDQTSVSGSSQKSGPAPSMKADFLKEAKHILQRLSDKSYPFAQYYLADGFASGLFNSGKADLERAFPLFLAASKHGHAEAMYRTALCYEYGWGCRVDAAKAVQFYQHAASKNHPGAMLRLGRACLTGEMGLTKRYREGIRWLTRGAESADLQYNQAPFDLACLYEEGYGPDVFKDESYAAQLYTKAADLGHREAAYRLGEAYELGQLNCPTDPSLSIHFYTNAAEQGQPQAQMALCAWYMIGVSGMLEKDEGEAYEWARRAAEQGLPKAQYTVGYFTESGIGCRRDPLEANVWYVKAADQGEDRAKHRIAAIRAASSGADPMLAAKKGSKKKDPLAATQNGNGGGKGDTSKADGEKKKKFGIF